MNIARHIIITACTGIVLWLMLLVGGLIWAMFSTPADSSALTRSGAPSISKRVPRRTES